MRTPRSVAKVALVWLSISLSAFATKIAPTPLSAQINAAAVVVVGRVEEVTAHGRFGWKLSDPKTRTGPGLSNELRLHVTLDSKRVLKGTIPPEVRVILPLWKLWHNDLEGAREVYLEKEFIFFLSSDLLPASAAEFVHFDFELPAVREEIAKSKRSPVNTLPSTAPGRRG